VNRKLTLIGIVLLGLGIWLAATTVGKCLSEASSWPSGVQCPVAYVGLTIFVLLTLGLTSLAISVTS
jgi:formate hydrogenlyase subunit 3/multisubunit Na+/H+ antiporter MnhD subunit